MNLELLAMRWLRWERRCVIVLTERSPRALWCGEPDVLGMTKDRYLYEIEVKRSWADFKKDSEKVSRQNRRVIGYQHLFPKHFYYLVPAGLSDRVLAGLPEWAGLMRGPRDDEVPVVQMVRQAPVWRPSSRLTPKECGYLVMKMSNQILALAEESERGFNQGRDGDESWLPIYYPDYQNYQI